LAGRRMPRNNARGPAADAANCLRGWRTNLSLAANCQVTAMIHPAHLA
jgi:hypothetical protein